MNRAGGMVEPTPPECALAAEMFDHFCSAGTMKQILALHREICDTLNLKPNRLPDFYPKLKAKLASSWKAQALFKKFDARANHKVYGKGRVCAANKVLIIGAGPCGLRAAIECQLLGAKVVVIEKRDRMSRNNVLHLWPFVIHDLRALGAKKFFGKFCAGSIDHISIRQLQCILLKVALLLGVEFHEGVSFEELLEPTVTANNESLGWRANVSPSNHPVSMYEFDALVGADGKRNTLGGFKRKEFRGKLAMAITANFINRHSEQEASVPEISGVAFIFNQKFFKDLKQATGIDLENIVYYKDDTHYFVMTAKKQSLIDKGVLLNDFAEVSRLLSVENVDRAALMRYAQEAARFSTGGRLPLNDFALNHYGEPDVALFDFTSMYAAENASMVYERMGRRLLCQLVGDSLLEPFWPTGSGCARGFLSALDAAWAVRSWGHSPQPHPLHVVAERESIYRLLGQTTSENLHRDLGSFTLDPGTRYRNLNRTLVAPHRVACFYDADEPLPLDAPSSARKRRRESDVPEEVLASWLAVPNLKAAVSGALAAAVRRYRPDLLPDSAAPAHLYLVLHRELGIPPPVGSNGGTLRDIPESKLRSYLSKVYSAFKGEVPHVQHSSQVFHQLKQQAERRTNNDNSISAYSNAAEADKSHSSYKRKRRARAVSTDPADYIRKQIGRLALDDITALARLIDGHDHSTDHTAKQKHIQEKILALIDAEDSPDPQTLRDSLSRLLQGTSETRVKDSSHLTSYFDENKPKQKPVRPPRKLKPLDPSCIRTQTNLDDAFEIARPERRKLKGLDPSSVIPFDLDLDDVELPKKNEPKNKPRKLKGLDPDTIRRKDLNQGSKLAIELNDIEHPSTKKTERSESPVLVEPSALESFDYVRHSPKVERIRSSSVDTSEAKRIAQMFERTDRIERKRRSPEKPGPVSQKMATRIACTNSVINPRPRSNSCQEISHGPFEGTIASIGTPLESRKKRVLDLISGKRNSPGRRQREVSRNRVAKSVAMLASERKMSGGAITSADLENDVGLQQYRASAPDFDDRVRKLEKQLQHYEEGRIVGGGGRTAGGGARVAKLAAELSGNNTQVLPKASKPKDLMRSVGKIERDDWNMKEIEKKILENRLGRPEPRAAEKVPKWDREQFLGRQRKLKGDGSDEKWGEIDETLHKLDQKLRDSGRPDHGTNKVANLANKFVNKDPEPEPVKIQPKDEKKSWRGPMTAGAQCAACGMRVFAAEGVIADGLTVHRACFRCAVCRTVLRPGSYTMERFGSRLVCLRHSGVSATDGASKTPRVNAVATPERISVELSDSAAREIDEDEWTDRNCLASETSAANNLSDDEESSSDEFTDAVESDAAPQRSPSPERIPALAHDIYLSDDSYPYDDYTDDGNDSSGNESCSRMRALREARRREVPADARPPTDSSEVESEEESSSDEESVSSGTEVSTDSEFARDEGHLPAILVTPAPTISIPPVAQTPREYPLSRTMSAGGLATQRALELKRKYLLGEPSPPAVRKSDSTSQIDSKLAAFTNNITEFQKMLNPAAPTPTLAYAKVDQPMPDIIKNLCTTAPVDLLAKTEKTLLHDYIISERSEPGSESARLEPENDALDSDSLSERTETGQAGNNPPPPPRLEVHDEGGELIQLDSLVTLDSEEQITGTNTSTAPTVLPADKKEDSSSSREASTLALTESEGSSWAGEGSLETSVGRRAPTNLAKPKTVQLINDDLPHVCGRTDSNEVRFLNAQEHFAFADEGDAIEETLPPNRGYMELVDSPPDHARDRSMDFIERAFSETVYRIPPSHTEIVHTLPPDLNVPYCDSNTTSPTKTDTESSEKTSSSKSHAIPDKSQESEKIHTAPDSHSKSEKSPTESQKSLTKSDVSQTESEIIRTKADTNDKSESRSENRRSIHENIKKSEPSSPSAGIEPGLESLSLSSMPSPPLASPSEITQAEADAEAGRVARLRRERDHQTEVVRRLVLARLGGVPPVAGQKRRPRLPPIPFTPPVTPPVMAPPPPVPPPPCPAPAPALSDPELARASPSPRRNNIMRTISVYINRHLHPKHKWASEPNLSSHQEPLSRVNHAHKSTGALLEGAQEPPPVPPPPAGYCPPLDKTRYIAPRIPAEQQAATVAELVQVSATRDAHQALLNADRRRSAASGGD